MTPIDPSPSSPQLLIETTPSALVRVGALTPVQAFGADFALLAPDTRIQELQRCGYDDTTRN